MSWPVRTAVCCLALAVLPGCSDVSPEHPDTGYTFPHAEGFDEPAAHATPWFETPEGCVVCHLDAPPGAPGRSCLECHPEFPHPDGYEDAPAHGPAGAGGGVACESCHGTGERRPAGRENSACRDCHVDYPHRATWQLPQIHGPRVVEGGIRVCGTCHGQNGTGGAIAGTCQECHATYPHPRSFGLPANHGALALGDGVASCATACHGDDFSGGGSGVACADCHATFPHGDDYRGLDHRDDVHTHGEATCLGCHEGGVGFPADFTCAETCHGGSG